MYPLDSVLNLEHVVLRQVLKIEPATSWLVRYSNIVIIIIIIEYTAY
jgi:hypothetical protein